MRQCPKCNKICDNSWKVCLVCNEKLTDDVNPNAPVSNKNSAKEPVSIAVIILGWFLFLGGIWYFLAVTYLSTSPMLSFTNRLISLNREDLGYTWGGLGFIFIVLPLLFAVCGGFILAFLRKPAIASLGSILLAVIVINGPMLQAGIGQMLANKSIENIKIIKISPGEYKYFYDFYHINPQYKSFREITIKANKSVDDENLILTKLKDEALKIGADGVLVEENDIKKTGSEISCSTFFTVDVPETGPKLIKSLRSWNKNNVKYAISRLGELKYQEAGPEILKIMNGQKDKTPNNDIYEESVVALASLKYQEIWPLLVKLAESQKEEDMALAVRGMGAFGDARALPYLETIKKRHENRDYVPYYTMHEGEKIRTVILHSSNIDEAIRRIEKQQ